MKKGDWLLSKIDFYDGDYIDNNNNLVGKSFLGVKKFFEKPIFKKGIKYQIKQVLSNRIPTGGTGGMGISNIIRSASFSPQYYTYKTYEIEKKNLSERDIKVLFYSHREERKLKLKKIEKNNN